MAITMWTDLDVTYIERVPHTKSLHGTIEYATQHLPTMTDRAKEQAKKLEPDEGEEVKFLCHIVNKSNHAVANVDAEVLIDGKVMKTDTKRLMNIGETWIVEAPWKWQKGQHTIECRVDPQGNIQEDCKTNNSLVDRIDGLGFRIFVTKRCYEDFNSRLNMVGSKSFEDYIQYHLSEMNRTFKDAVYPATPQGCSERVRLDQLYICVDNEDMQRKQREMNESDHQGGWSFDVWDRQDIRAKTLDSGLCHELMHQLGIIDIYTLNCAPEGNTILAPDGKEIGIGFYWEDQECVMIRCGGWYINYDEYRSVNGELVPMEMWGPPLNKLSEHTAAALEVQKGRPRGYFGDYLWAMPKTTNIRILDSMGEPVNDAEVKCYQTLKSAHAHKKADLNTTPATEGNTDKAGKITLKNYPVPELEPSFDGFTMKPNPYGRVNNHGMESTFFITISARGQTEYRWLPITILNLAFWTGNEDEYTVTYRTKIPPKGMNLSPPIPLLDGNTLSWEPVSGASFYRVYGLNRIATEKDGSWYTFIANTDRTIFDLPITDTPHYAVIVTSVNDAGMESKFSEAVQMPPSWSLKQAYGFNLGKAGEWNLKRYIFKQQLRWLLGNVEFDQPNQEVTDAKYAVSFRIKPGYFATFQVNDDGIADGGIFGGAKFTEEAVKFFSHELALQEMRNRRRP